MSVVCEMPAGYSVNGPLSADAPMFSTIVPYSATCETQSGGKCSKDEHKHPGHPKSDKNDCMKNKDMKNGGKKKKSKKNTLRK